MLWWVTPARESRRSSQSSTSSPAALVTKISSNSVIGPAYSGATQ